MTLTDEQLAEIKRLNEARTPGQWEILPRGHYVNTDGYLAQLTSRKIMRSPNDLEFVAAASWAVPVLVEEVERLRGELAALRAEVKMHESNMASLKAIVEKGTTDKHG